MICICTLAKGIEDQSESLGEVGPLEGNVRSQARSFFEIKAGELEYLSVRIWDKRKRVKAKPSAVKSGEYSRRAPTKLEPQVASSSVHR